MRAIIFLLTLCTSLSFSQPIDHNLKRGFAVNGYDVVAYFKNTPLEGSKKIITEYNGAKYKFSSNENLNIFKNSPEKYLPQYGGYCAYAIL
ncbi:YHS domain-containing (seleno)protein [Flavivirga sp. 57AJ16]|uniref:YHS domain-containing (seleno)protein n=1 Tax=Flavivirga sp. 57AJ16 TaxID=3025307 RepID=UPI0023651374|nr:YHS domain-containing (seleno)protein [Flavivirga sp. 57AJ16]MDD7884543.1 YHS domain-containing (seleno)protein [Flavivirga sp. 57AJ16]